MGGKNKKKLRRVARRFMEDPIIPRTHKKAVKEGK
jgi:hypothetical protein